jgi:hypothetical protein
MAWIPLLQSLVIYETNDPLSFVLKYYVIYETFRPQLY